ncbi:hypothetical protein OG892_12220 [Streptomyces sp. NBC_00341]|uniref:hypothetical protein n=1 Tax=Streptomyces sp. NBC_00341 TaxID=2975717 RepID=UPI00308E39D5|nr:hypothetical protein OG892_12220 [Streptomyces sp. NBC_00341]
MFLKLLKSLELVELLKLLESLESLELSGLPGFLESVGSTADNCCNEKRGIPDTERHGSG